MGWTGFLPVLCRLLLPASILAAAAWRLASGFRAPRPRRQRPASPSRKGPAELAAVLEKARTRPYYRDAAAERLRALARDAIALREGLDEAGAREGLLEASAAIDPGLGAFVAEDFMATGKADQGDFLDRLEDCLGTIEAYEGCSKRRDHNG